jgi:hypothetical protein
MTVMTSEILRDTKPLVSLPIVDRSEPLARHTGGRGFRTKHGCPTKARRDQDYEHK